MICRQVTFTWIVVYIFRLTSKVPSKCFNRFPFTPLCVNEFINPNLPLNANQKGNNSSSGQ
jgi:hypothetical protein